jgi:hypothetical protein
MSLLPHRQSLWRHVEERGHAAGRVVGSSQRRLQSPLAALMEKGVITSPVASDPTLRKRWRIIARNCATGTRVGCSHGTWGIDWRRSSDDRKTKPHSHNGRNHHRYRRSNRIWAHSSASFRRGQDSGYVGVRACVDLSPNRRFGCRLECNHENPCHRPH